MNIESTRFPTLGNMLESIGVVPIATVPLHPEFPLPVIRTARRLEEPVKHYVHVAPSGFDEPSTSEVE